MCLCDIDRYANCLGHNYYQNSGECYEDNTTYPTSTLCFCKQCYFGTECQLTTTGFDLSVDDILGYSMLLL